MQFDLGRAVGSPSPESRIPAKNLFVTPHFLLWHGVTQRVNSGAEALGFGTSKGRYRGNFQGRASVLRCEVHGTARPVRVAGRTGDGCPARCDAVRPALQDVCRPGGRNYGAAAGLLPLFPGLSDKLGQEGMDACSRPSDVGHRASEAG